MRAVSPSGPPREVSYILPSVFDNNPLVVKEAASCRTPSVLVRDSSSAEGVTHMENGFLIEESTQAMIPVLEWAVQNPDEVRKIGQKAAETLYVSWVPANGSMP